MSLDQTPLRLGLIVFCTVEKGRLEHDSSVFQAVTGLRQRSLGLCMKLVCAYHIACRQRTTRGQAPCCSSDAPMVNFSRKRSYVLRQLFGTRPVSPSVPVLGFNVDGFRL